jgi:hypothetical protein
LSLSTRLAQPGDAKDITRLFNQQYDTYFGKFSDDEQLSSSLEDMHRAIDNGEQPWGAVYVLEGDTGVVGASALKNNRPGWCEYSSTVIAPEARGGNGYSQLHAKRREAHDSYYPDLKGYTQTVSFTAKSQKGSLNAGFTPVGYSDGRFFEANDGDGRISTVCMIDSAEDYTSNGTACLPDGSVKDAASKALENLNRQGAGIERCFENPRGEPGNLEVWTQAIPAMGVARLRAMESSHPGSETMPYNEAIDWIETKRQKPEIEWLHIELEAASPAAYQMSQDENLEFERYHADGILTHDGWRDTLGLQDRPGGSLERQFVQPAKDIIEETSIPYSHQEVVGEFSGTKVHGLEIGQE